MSWEWSFVWQILPQLIEGVKITILASLLASALAMILGLAIAIGRRSAYPLLSSALHFSVNFVRGTPLLVQLYFVFYVLPDTGIYLSPLAAGVLTLGIHYSSYTSEVYRAGIDNVDRGLWEAARALNLSRAQIWRYVVIPTAVPPMLPTLANYVVGMFKETPLLSTITVLELMNRAQIIANLNYRYLEPITLVGIFFLAVSIPAVMALHYIERRFGPSGSRHPNMAIF
ncbi:MAG: ectoine/hydroxyectoine ABC transporter permease subunit EhuD [Mesorhizobium sp.]|uniref:ectoine/hydroxyectoine ABC transporter permease subunit EhuD n=1 Tax=Mesorhizobium sp. TaxID=1871066 RepID=UPI000FE86484|nr:ectoine/hydroxyectoine ABC transporter permease subunit EhuD [Mesorhizobium sp.]RWF89924.1 MAG: ectoine/hydroxyectoine ABC transporter permease subunit EhuD [Mesorhizobium sp.]RWJ45277.1 MAG: ectoine/hydroxyectoine ABC transporter permease subunit EhuD [Mesorhizobium sp.]RWJ56609.1 MAG: ectoine/hydroxyectoine ABC transporter permease subunit EhuD [Mesorhizobium sp.]RWJ60863.1 MAG: ectoine/hydroxyectoine ABC transporter permease subunit EhuD [Mesorhizobium sp.]RWJ91613.1 MAG: ectoine/hydroxy